MKSCILFSGLRSAEQGGSAVSRRQLLSLVSTPLSAGRLSMITVSPRRSVGAWTCSIYAWNATRFIGPSRTMGAVMLSTRSSPVKVDVFQCPCGTAARHRSTFRARPRSLAILVEAPVSSMNNRLCGSMSGYAANHARRRARLNKVPLEHSSLE